MKKVKRARGVSGRVFNIGGRIKGGKRAVLIFLFVAILALISNWNIISPSLTNIDLKFNVETSKSYLVWNGREYEPFGFGVDSLMGEQIGMVDWDRKSRVYTADGYSSDEWLIHKYHSGEMDVAELYRELTVESIPAELEQYKLRPDTRRETAERMMENDGREIIANSMCGWNFTLTEAKLADITNQVASYTGFALDNAFGEHYGKGIDVFTYDTVPNEMDESTSRAIMATYLFVFSGDELLYKTRFNTAEHFEFVKNLCNEVVQN